MSISETLDEGLYSALRKPQCIRCRKEMWVLRITPIEDGWERRLFECSGCGLQEQIETQIS